MRVAQLDDRLGQGRPDLDGLRLRVDDLLELAGRHVERALASKSERVEVLQARLALLGPRDTLRRGYAIVQSPSDSAVVSDVSKLRAGDRVEVTLARGGFGADVTSVRGPASEDAGEEPGTLPRVDS